MICVACIQWIMLCDPSDGSVSNMSQHLYIYMWTVCLIVSVARTHRPSPGYKYLYICMLLL
jgi:hypothetical protein